MAGSRPYRITADEPVRDVIAAEDHIAARLDVPPVLDRVETGELVRGELARRHFEDDGAGGMVRERGGVRVQVKPETGAVSVSAEATGVVEAPPAAPPNGGCGCRMRAAVEESVRRRRKAI